MVHSDLPSATRGGVRHQVSRLADALAKRGHRVTALTFTDAPPGVAYEARTLPVASTLARDRRLRMVSAPFVFAATSYSAFDIVHVHGDSQLLWRRKTPVLRTFYGSAADEARYATSTRQRILQRYHHLGERASRRMATRTVGISRTTGAAIGQLDAVIPCGCDLEFFRPGIKEVRPTVLFVGTWEGRKRGKLVAEVFERVVRPRIPDARLWMVVDRQVHGRGIESFTDIPDIQVADLMRRAWLFTMPSTYEGFGVPYIEALASGTPVVTTPNPGARELFADEVAGMLVEEESLGSALADVLVDAARLHTMSASARGASERFGWGAVCAAYELQYMTAIGAKVTMDGRVGRKIQGFKAPRSSRAQ